MPVTYNHHTEKMSLIDMNYEYKGNEAQQQSTKYFSWTKVEYAEHFNFSIFPFPALISARKGNKRCFLIFIVGNVIWKAQLRLVKLFLSSTKISSAVKRISILLIKIDISVPLNINEPRWLVPKIHHEFFWTPQQQTNRIEHFCWKLINVWPNHQLYLSMYKHVANTCI